ncbi:MAG: Vps62-related protein [Phycisphaerales bacterium]|nr:Vps62-related protein [Phycisphaerales bacterium]
MNGILPKPIRPAAAMLVGVCVLAAVPCHAADVDGDDIEDAVEALLIDRFAPIYYLHPDETYKPATTHWYMARVDLRYHHESCSDHGILEKPDVNDSTIGEQFHQNTQAFCIHGGDPIQSSGTAQVQSQYFLQIPNDDQEEITRAGMPNASDWQCYAHVFWSPSHPMHYDVQYIFFYPYNGNLGGLGGAHEGDHEHVTVRVASDQETIQAMYFSAHDGEGRWYGADELVYDAETGRPVVFSAQDSHASYPYAGTWQRPFPLPDDHTGYGQKKDFLGDVVNVGEHSLLSSAPSVGNEWLLYSGHWGELGPFYDGPYGPAFQAWFVQDDVANNPPPFLPFDHYVKKGGIPGIECLFDFNGQGTWGCQWVKIPYAVSHMPPGHHLNVRSDVYTLNEPTTLTGNMTITSYGGPATISSP